MKLGNEFISACFTLDGIDEAIVKDLAVCEVCGEPVAPYADLAWVADRLDRADHLRILCPRHRRAAAVAAAEMQTAPGIQSRDPSLGAAEDAGGS